MFKKSSQWQCVRRDEMSQENKVLRCNPLPLLLLSSRADYWEVEGVFGRQSLLPHPDILAEVIEVADNEVGVSLLFDQSVCT